MTKLKGPAKRLKLLANQIPNDRVTRTLIKLLEYSRPPSGDYSVAIIAASLVEKALEVAILSHCRALESEDRKAIFNFDNQGPLADFSARIKMAFALGSISPNVRADLDNIRQIRNAFAHSVIPLDFETTEIIEMCETLHWPKRLMGAAADLLAGTARGKYVMTTLEIAERLRAGVSLEEPRNYLASLLPRMRAGGSKLPTLP